MLGKTPNVQRKTKWTAAVTAKSRSRSRNNRENDAIATTARTLLAAVQGNTIGIVNGGSTHERKYGTTTIPSVKTVHRGSCAVRGNIVEFGLVVGGLRRESLTGRHRAAKRKQRVHHRAGCEAGPPKSPDSQRRHAERQKHHQKQRRRRWRQRRLPQP